MLTKGVMYVAFRKEYLWQCAHSVKILQEVCGPISVCVVTNADPTSVWEGTDDVTFTMVKQPNDMNRFFRTKAIEYSPFDLTCCMDTDTAVKSKKFLSGFDKLSSHDVLLAVNAVVGRSYLYGIKQDGLRRLYQVADARWGYKFPLTLYSGGVVFFKKSEGAKDFFKKWNTFWYEYGGGRDMPPLGMAAQKTKAKIESLSGEWNGLGDDVIVDHIRKRGPDIPGLPRVAKYKPKILRIENGRASVEWRKE